MSVSRIISTCREAALHTPEWAAHSIGITGIALMALGCFASLRGSPLPKVCLPGISGFMCTYLAGWILHQHQIKQGVWFEGVRKSPPKMPKSTLRSLDLSTLHHDILQHILSFLDTAALKNAALTSKSWRTAARKLPTYWKPIVMGEILTMAEPSSTTLLYRFDGNHATRWGLLGELDIFPDYTLQGKQTWHCDSQRLARLEQGTSCVLSDRTSFPCPKQPATTLFLYDGDIFIGSSDGSIHQCTPTGEVKNEWKVNGGSSAPWIKKVCVDEDYVVAMFGPECHFHFISRQDPNDRGSVKHHKPLENLEFCVHHAGLFFIYEQTLVRFDLEKRATKKFSIPRECQGTFLGVWNRVAFFSTSNALYPVHYPSSTVINRINHHSRLLSCIFEETDSQLTLFGFHPVGLHTFSWGLRLQEGPEPKVSGTFAPTSALAPSLTDSLHTGACFKRKPSIVHKESAVSLYDVYTSLDSQHIVRYTSSPDEDPYDEFFDELQKHDQNNTLDSSSWKERAYQIDEERFTEPLCSEIRWPKHMQPCVLHGDGMSYIQDGRHLMTQNLNDGESHTIEAPWSGNKESFSRLCHDQTFLYAATSRGRVMRYSLDGALTQSIQLTDKTIDLFYADSTQIICIAWATEALECIWTAHHDFEPTQTGKVVFTNEIPSEWYLDQNALFYQYPHSPAYAYLFRTQRAQKIKTFGQVHFLHTQGNVLMMRENERLVLVNYETGELLQSIAMGEDFNDLWASAKFRGAEILTVYKKKSTTLTWRDAHENS